MNYIDSIILIPLVFAAISGFRSGIITQLGGIAGLFLGVFLAWRYGEAVGAATGVEPSASFAAGFILILVLVMLCIALASRALRGVFRIVGLGVVDRIGGVALSLAKTVLFLGIFLYGFDTVNNQTRWVAEPDLDKSRLYSPFIGVAEWAFPFVGELVDDLVHPQANDRPEAEPGSMIAGEVNQQQEG